MYECMFESECISFNKTKVMVQWMKSDLRLMDKIGFINVCVCLIYYKYLIVS